MNKKIVTVIIGQNCQDTIGMCLESVKDSDEIIYLDGGSYDNTMRIVKEFGIDNDKVQKGLTILNNIFNSTNPNAISNQRNFYLEYIKEYFPDYWCLVLDADEVLDDNGITKLREFINEAPLHNIYSVKMRHLMYTLGLEDATKKFHYVPNRFFKVTDDLVYPDGEHCILNNEVSEGSIVSTQIWHLGYIGGVWDVKKRYDQQKLRNNGHNEKYLDTWNKSHMLANYPVAKFNVEELPQTILSNFGLSKDEIYFADRNIENKHPILVRQWNDFFKPESVADFGCGLGPYLFIWESIVKDCKGFDISEYATKHKICSSEIRQFELGAGVIVGEKYDLVTAIDVLEHLKYENLAKAISTLCDVSSKYILASIPFKGTPNCENDPTHIIKESKDWWIKQFEGVGLKVIPTPDEFLFKEQLILLKK